MSKSQKKLEGKQENITKDGRQKSRTDNRLQDLKQEREFEIELEFLLLGGVFTEM